MNIELKNEIVKAYLTKPIEELTRLFGLSRYRILKVLEEYSIPIRDDRYILVPPDLQNKILDEFNKKHTSISDLASLFKYSRRTIRHILFDLNSEKLITHRRYRTSSISDEDCNKIVSLFLDSSTIPQISIIMNLSTRTIADILKRNNVSAKDRHFYSSACKKEILTRYLDKKESIFKIATDLSLRHKKVTLFLKAEGVFRTLDPSVIIKHYNDGISIKKIASAYLTSAQTISSILKEGKVKIDANRKRRIVLTSRQEEELISFVRSGTKVCEIKSVLSFKCSQKIVEATIKKYFPFVSGTNIRSLWKQRFDKETLDKKIEQLNQLIREKPPAKGGSRGISGWFNGVHHFRSLPELTYILFLEESGIRWKTGEYNNFNIPYTLNGKNRNYWPDFILEEKDVIEVKAESFKHDATTLEKACAAKLYCENRGMSYQIVNIKVNNRKIKIALDKGLIKFAKDGELRFLKRFPTTSSVY